MRFVVLSVVIVVELGMLCVWVAVVATLAAIELPADRCFWRWSDYEVKDRCLT